MGDVKIIAAQPQVQITFTAAEIRALREGITGAGLLAGAWAKIRDADIALAATTAPRSFPRF